jgi:hypothetical protein
LAPFPSVRNIVAQLNEGYTNEVAHCVLPALSILDVPKSKKTITGIYNSEECNEVVRFVFQERFLMKAQSAMLDFQKKLLTEDASDSVGVRDPRFGIFLPQRHRRIEPLAQLDEIFIGNGVCNQLGEQHEYQACWHSR